MAERGSARRLLSRLRCGLQTGLSCTAGLSCRPSSSSSESSSNIVKRRPVTGLSPRSEVRDDRKCLRSRDRKSASDDSVACADSGVGHSLESTSGHVTSGLTTTSSTHDDVARRRKRRSTRLTTVDELDAPPEPEVVTWSRGDVTENDVIEPTTTTRQHRRPPCACCNRFRGK